MQRIYNFLSLRKSSGAPVFPIARPSGRVMVEQVDQMLRENQLAPPNLDISLGTQSDLERWLETATDSVPNRIPMSTSAPQLRCISFEKIEYTIDPEKLNLINALALAVFDICNLAKKSPYKISASEGKTVMTMQGTAVVVTTHNMEFRLGQISRKIERHLEKFNLANTNGEPLLSDRIPTKAIAIRADGKNGVWFKRVRYLFTLGIYDYFLEYETGEISDLSTRKLEKKGFQMTQIRFDITRFFDLPDSFNREYSALCECRINYREPRYDELYTKMGEVGLNHIESPFLIIHVGNGFDANKKQLFFHHLPTFHRHVRKPSIPIRKVKSESDMAALEKSL